MLQRLDLASVGAVFVNPLEDKRVPAFLRTSQADYDKIVRDMPDLNKIGYEALYQQLTQMEWHFPAHITSS